jgi:hypothetical protein
VKQTGILHTLMACAPHRNLGRRSYGEAGESRAQQDDESPVRSKDSLRIDCSDDGAGERVVLIDGSVSGNRQRKTALFCLQLVRHSRHCPTV